MKIVGCGGLAPNKQREPIDRFALDLSGAEKPDVLLIATPKAEKGTFDAAIQKALGYYASLGVNVEALYDTFDQPPTPTEIAHKIGVASLINVSGGDTLRAVEKFTKWGAVPHLQTAAKNNTVLNGTSAGAGIWFDVVHSDSESYRIPKGDPWEYKLVDTLGFQPGTVCPHYNSKTEGGESRVTNFARNVLENPSLPQPMYGIDNRAAIVVDGLDISYITIDLEQMVHEIDPQTGLSIGSLPLQHNKYAAA